MSGTIKQALREATAQLAECFRLTGADPDGDSDSMLAKFAVEEVGRLRRESDAAQTQLDQLLAAIRAHWKAKYAGRDYDGTPITPEDSPLYDASVSVRAALDPTQQSGAGEVARLVELQNEINSGVQAELKDQPPVDDLGGAGKRWTKVPSAFCAAPRPQEKPDLLEEAIAEMERRALGCLPETLASLNQVVERRGRYLAFREAATYLRNLAGQEGGGRTDG